MVNYIRIFQNLISLIIILMVKEIFKSIDIYGSPYNFTVFSKYIYQTTIGGIATVITILLYLYFLYLLGIDFWFRKNPHFFDQKVILQNYPLYTLNNDNLLVGFRLEDFDGNYIDISRLLDVSVVHYQYSQIDNILVPKSSIMETIDCSLMNQDKLNLITKKNLSHITCINFKNTTLGGNWDGNFVNYIFV
jgi:hypothetical protein